MNLKSGEGKYYTCVGEGKLEIKKASFSQCLMFAMSHPGKAPHPSPPGRVSQLSPGAAAALGARRRCTATPSFSEKLKENSSN